MSDKFNNIKICICAVNYPVTNKENNKNILLLAHLRLQSKLLTQDILGAETVCSQWQHAAPAAKLYFVVAL